MKMQIRSLAMAMLATVTLFFTACKKEGSQSNTDNTTEIKTHTDDQTQASGEMEQVSNDVNLAIEGIPSFSGRTANTASICGATATADTLNGAHTITITYNGPNCQGTHIRTGVVRLSMPSTSRWRNAGAVATVTFQNLNIKRIADNKTIILNGVQTHTNVSGGLLVNLSTQQTIIHTITSNSMAITFDNGSQRTWNVARKRTFTYNNGAVLSITGIGTTGGVNNAAEWGSNRFGNSFITTIEQPLVIREDCAYRLTSGEIKHQGFATSTVTFGLNAGGAPTACPGTGNYFYKLLWTGPNGGSVTAILPY